MILYKYCDPLGAIKILDTFELKLPFISEVNDPLECLPVFCSEQGETKIKERCLIGFKRKDFPINEELINNLDNKIKNGEMQELLKIQARNHAKEWNNSKGCLLSVSKTAQNTVMWAHYAEKHKGVVIGFDFKTFFKLHEKQIGIVMEPVKYSKERAKIDVSIDQMTEEWWKAMEYALLNKSSDWQYEQEYRTIFLDDMLKQWCELGLACLKEYKGKSTFFLRFYPMAIREVIFGLFTEESLKSEIKTLLNRQELKHVKSSKTVESDSYDFNLAEEKIS
ncbi:MAG: DUF2971 domain-containing protein [Candidatus Omnitrophota bacterium]